MSFPDLIYNIAHDYPGKVPALAARMGKNKTVLQHKLDPDYPSHAINADEIERIIDLTHTNRQAAEFFAGKADCVVIAMLACAGSDMELLDSFMQVVAQLGEFSAEFQRDWADGRIDAREFARLTKESDDVIARLLELRNRIGQMVEEPSVRSFLTQK